MATDSAPSAFKVVLSFSRRCPSEDVPTVLVKKRPTFMDISTRAICMVLGNGRRHISSPAAHLIVREGQDLHSFVTVDPTLGGNGGAGAHGDDGGLQDAPVEPKRHAIPGVVARSVRDEADGRYPKPTRNNTPPLSAGSSYPWSPAMSG